MKRQTSIDVYRKIKEQGLLVGRRMMVYEALYKIGPATTNELFKYIHGTTTINQPNIHARLAELREMGCVMELGTVVCSVTKNKVIQFDVTDKIPIKIKKTKRIKCPHCSGKGYQEQGTLL